MGLPVGKMMSVRGLLSWHGTAATAAVLLLGTVVHVHAQEGNFLEMLFGVRPAPQQVQPAQAAAPGDRAYRSRIRVGAARHQLRTRYAALPVKIRIGDKADKTDKGDRQIPIDMKQGAAAALLKDETLRPGDIVVLNTGARVFTGSTGKRHAMSDFEPASTSHRVDKSTRRLLAGMVVPVGALPSDAARRMTARLRKAMPADQPAAVQASTAMRVINPWQTNP